ncbi:hypothetical protein QWY86_10850 [Pedobacter aquatilis]|uniref:hypothetical protein n=1 Tax=Pedobacter aquatilis TaxID=351343 RepID=UPI0025B2AF1D|nr:hypothetical protein [Pedobacter aquatilis]MDN3587169.1 hypothetical protein [Pedobacter aquatilis]
MVNVHQKKQLSIYQSIAKNVNNKKWTCYQPGCFNDAINSHLLQRNGILSHIAENSSLIQVGAKDIFQFEGTGAVTFKRLGINNAISYPLFCNGHDTQIFKPIEQQSIDFHDYHSQLLFSYRALCAELRKKEKSLEINERLYQSKNLIALMEKDFFKMLETRKIGHKLAVRDLKTFKKSFEDELDSPNGNFSFKTLIFPSIKVSASAIFSYMDDTDRLDGRYLDEQPLDTVFVNVIPQEISSIVIIGYQNNRTNKWIVDYIQKWQDCLDDEFGRLLSDLVTRFETWTMAESLYQRIPDLSVKSYLSAFENTMHSGIDRTTLLNFNLFNLDE